MIGIYEDYPKTFKSYEEYNEVRSLYRKVFGTKDGKKVLAYILTDLGFGNEIKSEEQSVLNNYAIRLLEMTGAFHEGNVFALTDKLLSLPVWKETKPKEYNK